MNRLSLNYSTTTLLHIVVFAHLHCKNRGRARYCSAFGKLISIFFNNTAYQLSSLT